MSCKLGVKCTTQNREKAIPVIMASLLSVLSYDIFLEKCSVFIQATANNNG